MSEKIEYWGRFSTKPEEVEKLDVRTDIVRMSKGEMYLAACSDILRRQYGFVQATDSEMPTDAQGEPIPLFTYPCIEYIDQFDLSEKSVFEWGAGASTLYWMSRAKSVTSIEHNPKWYNKLQETKQDNVTVVLEQSENYPFTIAQQAQTFDLIVIDGGGFRYDCAVEAIKKLNKGGMIILDNSDWHPNTAACLKRSGLIQVDFSGFKASECHTSTTSVFLHREFDFSARENRQPSFCIGARKLGSDWDKPYARNINSNSGYKY